MTERSLAFLRALPEVDPPAALWSRIERTQARRRAARRAVSFAMAASVLVAAFLVTDAFVARDDSGETAERSSAIDGPAADRGIAVADAIARSHVLERDLAAIRVPGARASLSLEAELARVDADLSRAYARRAGEDELHTLWSARIAALETLVALHRHPEAIRI